MYLHPPSASHNPTSRWKNLAYRECGVPAESARFSMIVPHSFLSSRLAAIPGIKESLLEEFGVHLVTYDLPGFGESDPHPGRNLNSSSLDMLYLANALGIQGKFWVVGYSGTGMHAWAAPSIYSQQSCSSTWISITSAGAAPSSADTRQAQKPRVISESAVLGGGQPHLRGAPHDAVRGRAVGVGHRRQAGGALEQPLHPVDRLREGAELVRQLPKPQPRDALIAAGAIGGEENRGCFLGDGGAGDTGIVGTSSSGARRALEASDDRDAEMSPPPPPPTDSGRRCQLTDPEAAEWDALAGHAGEADSETKEAGRGPSSIQCYGCCYHRSLHPQGGGPGGRRQRQVRPGRGFRLPLRPRHLHRRQDLRVGHRRRTVPTGGGGAALDGDDEAGRQESQHRSHRRAEARGRQGEERTKL